MPDMEADDRGKSDDYYLELSPDPIRCLLFAQEELQECLLGPGPEPELSHGGQGSRDLHQFSPDMNVLAIQRTSSSVEFVNYSPVSGLDHIEYSQACKGKNTTILGFVWTHGTEILVITDHGVELFSCQSGETMRQALKCLSLGIIVEHSGTEARKVSCFRERRGIGCVVRNALYNFVAASTRSQSLMGTAFVYVYTIHKYIELRLETLVKLITDKIVLVDF
ncbi:hypothetical protein DMN91_012671 [Ooceraea biroi]|uniref:Regulator of MON1-CCZ1 complex N-terminal domain-containing protein n=1 Tax=Ooceraea biroi TaxID=2015173 RepID=A0A3L8D3K0_OOCBI|nr:hypothetical protein DMN91_012671 [Ooceraea biroi]